jgi:hypothetical protein
LPTTITTKEQGIKRIGWKRTGNKTSLIRKGARFCVSALFTKTRISGTKKTKEIAFFVNNS